GLALAWLWWKSPMSTPAIQSFNTALPFAIARTVDYGDLIALWVLPLCRLAWLPHACFHDFYRDFHAIGEGRPRCEDSLVFSTQSTHQLLAGISQASPILVQ
ncbi:hypothetical protein, partial [Pseudogulbenkiania ferrooxidans]|uniref:hypothetical protein n=1 Tax=Pseudogulbenkiania ferrooxidans TaxID=549169 RepID=UPI00256FC8C7